MPSLTSCYFCGEAVGASLGEYDLPAAGDEESVTVTLCASCGQKLHALLDRVDGPEGALAGTGVDPGSPAADGAAARDRPAESETGGSGGRIGHGRERDDESADRPDLPIDVDLPSQPAGEAADDGAPASDAPTGGAASGVSDPLDGDSDPVFDPEGTDQGDTNGSRSAADTGQSGADDADEGVVFGAASEADVASDDAVEAPGPEAAESPDSDPRPPAEQGAADESRSSDGSDDGEDATSGGGGVSPQTYNRVVRLLQNREFPVDRVEFETLASSAYDVDERDCAAALDVAIDKGLLLEEEGQLHRPE